MQNNDILGIKIKMWETAIVSVMKSGRVLFMARVIAKVFLTRWKAISLKNKLSYFSIVMIALSSVIAVMTMSMISNFLPQLNRITTYFLLVNNVIEDFSDEVSAYSVLIGRRDAQSNMIYQDSLIRCDQSMEELRDGGMGDVESHLLLQAIDTSFSSYRKTCQQALTQQKRGYSHIDDYYSSLTMAEYIELYLQQLLQVNLQQEIELSSNNIIWLRAYQRYALAAFFLTITVAVMFYCFYIHYTIHPLLQLTDMVERLSAGQLAQPDLPSTTNDEVGQLISFFNKMKTELQKREAYLMEKAELEARLRHREVVHEQMQRRLEEARVLALQTQINPHFLFNTLNTIMRTAELEGAADTTKLILHLAALFRYTLENKESLVSLSTELKVLNDYVELQKKRFGDRIRFSIVCSGEIEEKKVPMFILQPLVENAIKHGIGPRAKGGSIRVEIRTAEEGIQIRVMDDGVGMPPQKLRLVKESMVDSGNVTDNIGITNVYQRLQILCPGCKFVIQSQVDVGTVVDIILPKGG